MNYHAGRRSRLMLKVLVHCTSESLMDLDILYYTFLAQRYEIGETLPHCIESIQYH